MAADDAAQFGDIVSSLIAQYREKERLLANHLCPADQRIQNFLYDYLQDVPVAKLPLRTLSWTGPAWRGTLSLPVDRDEFASSILNSYRVKQGVLHNPQQRPPHDAGDFSRRRRRPADPRRQDRRAEGGVREDAEPRLQSAARDACACRSPPPSRNRRNVLSRCCCGRWSAPRCPDFTPRKTMEIRFFAPGSLVSNLDFVESIFGNARRSGAAGKRRRAGHRSIGPATPAASFSRRT